MAEDSNNTAENVVGKSKPAPKHTDLTVKEAGAAASSGDDGGVDDLPEGAVVLGGDDVTSNARPKPLHPFQDEHKGIGGVYAVGTDGVRRRVFEKYTDANGKTKHRPAV